MSDQNPIKTELTVLKTRRITFHGTNWGRKIPNNRAPLLPASVATTNLCYPVNRGTLFPGGMTHDLSFFLGVRQEFAPNIGFLSGVRKKTAGGTKRPEVNTFDAQEIERRPVLVKKRSVLGRRGGEKRKYTCQRLDPPCLRCMERHVRNETAFLRSNGRGRVEEC